jgi:FG-GAP repeat protein/VCBS repeat protein
MSLALAVVVWPLLGDVRVSVQHRIDELASPGDRFGWSLARLGDVDGDGRDELVVGSPRADHGGQNAGVVRVLSLDTTAVPLWVTQIAEGAAGLVLDPDDNFGESLAVLGDLDGNGYEDLAVGSPGDDDGGADQGALRVLFLGPGGLVQSFQKISRTQGGFTGSLCCGQVRFGKALATIGDLDGDGRAELAASTDTEQIFVLFLNASGTVRAHLELPRPAGSVIQDGLGGTLAGSGDVNGDGVVDLLVGAQRHYLRSAAFAYFLAPDGSLLGSRRNGWMDFDGAPTELAPLASALAPLGDLDGDGRRDFWMGTSRWPSFSCFNAPCGLDPGSAWTAELEPDGSVTSEHEVSRRPGSVPLDELGDGYGAALTALGDVDGNGVDDVAVGAPRDERFAFEQGSLWILLLERAESSPATPVGASSLGGRPPGAPRPVRPHKLSNLSGGIDRALQGYGGASPVVPIGDLDDDGIGDLALGTPGSDGPAGAVGAGAVRILFLGANGGVRAQTEITAASLGFGFAFSEVGWSLAPLGDLDGDGVEDLAFGAPEYRVVYVLFLRTDGTVRAIGDVSAGLPPEFYEVSYGAALAPLGDLDGDGVGDLAVGDAGGTEGELANRVLIAFLRANGTVRNFRQHLFGTGLGQLQRISLANLGDLNGDGRAELAFGEGQYSRLKVPFLNADGTLQSQRTHTSALGGGFGSAAAGIGDLDGDGVEDVAIGAPQTASGLGAYWLLFLDATGAERSRVSVSAPAGRLNLLDIHDEFGASLAYLGDPDGDGIENLAVGAPGDDDLRTNSGAVWILNLP